MKWDTLAAVRSAEHAEREIRTVARELRRVKRDGLPYNGPCIEWQSGSLAATRPEPHIALAAWYREANDIDADVEYIDSLIAAVIHEGGYREAVLSAAVDGLST